MALNTSEPKRWVNYPLDTLQNLLEGCLPFRNEPAMDNFELERIMRGASSTDKSKSGPRDSGVENRSVMDGHPKRVKRIDKGRVVALHEAGRSNRWTADDMGLREGTVCRVLKGMKEESREKD